MNEAGRVVERFVGIGDEEAGEVVNRDKGIRVEKREKKLDLNQ